MHDFYSIISLLLPEAIEPLAQRFAILNELDSLEEPIGRKALAEKVDMSERTLRTAIDSFREYNLVFVSQKGIKITPFGKQILTTIKASTQTTNHLFELEQNLKDYLNISYCWVVPGDLSKQPEIYELLSHAVQEVMLNFLGGKSQTVAVTGGTTLAEIGRYFTPELSNGRDLTFVTARGGVSGAYNIQSNSIVALMAQQAKAKSEPLYAPETTTKEAADALATDPKIQKTLALSYAADCMLISIGTADVMAKRLDLNDEQLQIIKDGQCVGEALGVFFDADGEEVLRLPRIGLSLEDLKDIPLLITVVGGADKADATKAYVRLIEHRGWLICDASLANEILKG